MALSNKISDSNNSAGSSQASSALSNLGQSSIKKSITSTNNKKEDSKNILENNLNSIFNGNNNDRQYGSIYNPSANFLNKWLSLGANPLLTFMGAQSNNTGPVAASADFNPDGPPFGWNGHLLGGDAVYQGSNPMYKDKNGKAITWSANMAMITASSSSKVSWMSEGGNHVTQMIAAGWDRGWSLGEMASKLGQLDIGNQTPHYSPAINQEANEILNSANKNARMTGSAIFLVDNQHEQYFVQSAEKMSQIARDLGLNVRVVHNMADFEKACKEAGDSGPKDLVLTGVFAHGGLLSRQNGHDEHNPNDTHGAAVGERFIHEADIKSAMAYAAKDAKGSFTMIETCHAGGANPNETEISDARKREEARREEEKNTAQKEETHQKKDDNSITIS